MKLTVHTFLTLDGVMQGPGGREEDTSGGFEFGGWLVPHLTMTWQDRGRLVRRSRRHPPRPDHVPAVPALLGAGHGPGQRRRHRPQWPAQVRGLQHHQQATWNNTTMLSGNFLEAIDDLKAGPGRELQVHGSHQLARALHDAGLVDEYRLFVFPVVLGQGKRLFDSVPRRPHSPWPGARRRRPGRST